MHVLYVDPTGSNRERSLFQSLPVETPIAISTRSMQVKMRSQSVAVETPIDFIILKGLNVQLHGR